MCDEYIKKFYSEVCQNLEGDFKIILEPNRAFAEDWIEYDTVKWEMEEPIQKFVNNLISNQVLTLEEKILKVYEFICLNYVYDANVLYFFKRDDSDPNNIKYIAVDWYGRIVDKKWIEKRKTHNRRICYEFSRFYAKAINTLIDDKEELEAFMLGDKENTHYVVGLAGKKYSIILDQDDFNNVKDLTRLKMNLTIKGIHILRDEKGIFKNALDNFNKNRLDELPEIEQAKNEFMQKDFIQYLNISIREINKYHIDSQGFFEYIRNLIENAGIKITKIWKEDLKNKEKRFERCLYFEYNNNGYLLDSIDKTLQIVDIEKLNKELFIFDTEKKEYKYYGG